MQSQHSSLVFQGQEEILSLQEEPSPSYKGFRPIKSGLPSIISLLFNSKSTDFDLNYICKISLLWP